MDDDSWPKLVRDLCAVLGPADTRLQTLGPAGHGWSGPPRRSTRLLKRI
jgi:hypothetical protein